MGVGLNARQAVDVYWTLKKYKLSFLLFNFAIKWGAEMQQYLGTQIWNHPDGGIKGNKRRGIATLFFLIYKVFQERELGTTKKPRSLTVAARGRL